MWMSGLLSFTSPYYLYSMVGQCYLLLDIIFQKHNKMYMVKNKKKKSHFYSALLHEVSLPSAPTLSPFPERQSITSYLGLL